MFWPIKTCTPLELELAIAKQYGKPIEGRDGDFVLRGYDVDGKIYLTSFDEQKVLDNLNPESAE